MAQSDEWLTVEEVTALLKVSKETVRRWIRDEALPVLRIGGRRAGYRIRRADLDAFIDQRYGPLGKVAA